MNFLCSGSAGDLIAWLGFVKEMGGGNLYLRLNQPVGYSERHPLGNVGLNEDYANKLLPLLRMQEYIDSAEIWTGQSIDINLDRVRELGLSLAPTHIPRLPTYCWPIALNLAEPWLEVGTAANRRVVVSRTLRYRNERCDYSCLKKEDILFVGLEEEHQNFEKLFFACEFLKCQDFRQLAAVIAGCDAFCGNQSLAWWLAESLVNCADLETPTKCYRVLEACPWAPNSSPSGWGGIECFTGTAFELACGMISESPGPILSECQWRV